MLYKQFTRHVFQDDPDHLSVVEGLDITDACRKFIEWNKQHWPHADFPLVGEPTVEVEEPGTGRVYFTSKSEMFDDLYGKGESDATGQDVYEIRRLDGDVISFYAGDWQAAFLERG